MRTRGPKTAFTLVELIVSLTITSIIAVFVFGFATSLAKLWRTTEGGVSTELDTQIALDTIVSDFESALFLEKGVPMLAVTAIPETAAADSTRWVAETIVGSGRPTSMNFEPANHRYGWAGSWIRLFTASPSVNAVGYQIIRRPVFNGSSEPRYLLHRSLIRQDKTLEGGYDISTGIYASSNTADALLKARLDSVILEDVVDFGVRFYVFEKGWPATVDTPAGMRLIFPATASSSLDANDVEHLASTFGGNDFTIRYPDVVEIFIRVLNDVGSRLLLEVQEVGIGKTNAELLLEYEKIILEHSRLYRRMVRRPGKESQG